MTIRKNVVTSLDAEGKANEKERHNQNRYAAGRAKTPETGRTGGRTEEARQA